MHFVNNLNDLILDDQYFLDVPAPDGNGSAPTGNIGLVGTFSRGPLNTPVLVTSYPDLVKKFGEADSAFTLTGAIAARGIFKQGNANVYVVRVQSSATPAASAQAVLADRNATPATVMTLQAKTPGTWGNQLSVTVADGTKTGTFKVSLQYGTEAESWDNLVIAQPETPIDGAVLAASVFGENGLSALASATFPNPANASLPAVGTYAFNGGDNGGLAADADYIGDTVAATGKKTGLQALDGSPVNFVLCAEQSSDAVNNGLIENAESITQNGGLPRMALVTFARGLSPDAVAAKSQQLDSDRAIAVYPWLQLFDTLTGAPQAVSALGSFAGLLAQLSPHLSTGNKPVYGILGIDKNLVIGPSELVTLSQARVNVVGVPTPAGPMGVRGSLTLSKDEASSQIYVRRMKDFINQKISEVGGMYVDQPITPDLMRQVFQSVDNILQPMKSPVNAADQKIADYKIICDSSNNPASSIAQNRLICDYAVKLLNLNRFMIFRTQIGAGVVITKQG